MAGNFSLIDWLIVSGYLLMLFGIGWVFTLLKPQTTRDYFLGANKMPIWLVAISVIATTQSAATFLGGPDQGYRSDYSYLAVNISAIIASLFIAKVLMPKFYAMKATTVYELLALRFNETAMKAAGAMYLVGRLFASGARLYLAAIAVSMILFSNINTENIIIASALLVIIGFSITFLNGIRSVIWSDLIQFIAYSFSAIAVLYFLLHHIPLTLPQIMSELKQTPEGLDKLRIFNTSFNFTEPYSLLSILSGMTLLYIASFGLDQDITQRLLTCEKGSDGSKAIILSAFIGIPLIWMFITIGELLYLFYDRPDLMETSANFSPSQEFQGEKITIFMHYILNELPSGLKGMVTVGVIAAAVSTINSGLNSMSSVIVQDFYRPWVLKKEQKPEHHFVRAGQIGMGLVGIALFLMSILCFYWQQYSGLPLLDFALSLMVFAYSGLLGVYFSVIYTNRGSTKSVISALIIGFVVTLLQQRYIIDLLKLPDGLGNIAFSWQLCIGTIVAFIVCQIGNTKKRGHPK